MAKGFSRTLCRVVWTEEPLLIPPKPNCTYCEDFMKIERKTIFSRRKILKTRRILSTNHLVTVLRGVCTKRIWRNASNLITKLTFRPENEIGFLKVRKNRLDLARELSLILETRKIWLPKMCDLVQLWTFSDHFLMHEHLAMRKMLGPGSYILITSNCKTDEHVRRRRFKCCPEQHFHHKWNHANIKCIRWRPSLMQWMSTNNGFDNRIFRKKLNLSRFSPCTFVCDMKDRGGLEGTHEVL